MRGEISIMNSKAKSAAEQSNIPRTVAINTLIDVVGALAAETLTDNVYLIDNNESYGSTHEGTDQLQSSVKVGDIVLWTVESLEPEAFASIEEIKFDSTCIRVEQRTFRGSDVTYWVGEILKKFDRCPYEMKILLGTQDEPLQTDTNPALVCNS